jgi:signal transduction histidine kinase
LLAVVAGTASTARTPRSGAGCHRLGLPEVTFFDSALERGARPRQAARMANKLRELLEPMNLAAYAAWAGIGFELFGTRPSSTGLLAQAAQEPVQLGFYLGFMLLFVGRELLGLHNRRALPIVLLQVAVALALASLSRASTAPILLVIAFAQLAQLLAPKELAVAFVAINAGLYCVFRFAWQATWPAMGTLLHASFQLFAIVASWYAVTAQRSRDELAATNLELLATRSLLAQSVRDSERLRLARELHDVAGHSLTALKLNLRALQRQPALADDAQLALCARLADELLGDIRGLVQQMRLHDGVELGELMQRLAAPFPKPRLHMDLEPGLRVPSLEQAETVLRTVQEALTNAARHGGADNLYLHMHRESDRLRLDIRDDGRGAGGALCFGNGLTGMRERLQAAGGGFEAQGGAGRGVNISAWLPLAPAPMQPLDA